VGLQPFSRKFAISKLHHALAARAGREGRRQIRPKKQIVFWIDRTVPKELRPYVKQGVEAWNRAFAAAGWVDAIAAREVPERDSTWNDLDLDHNVIRWVPRYDDGSAWGGSVVDPRTGEALHADIDVHSFNGASRFYAMAVDDNPPAPARRTRSSECHLADLMSAGLSDIRLSLIARGELAASAPLPRDIEGEIYKNVIMHEVGHTLGLRHNFKASSTIPYDSLMDTAFVRRNGVSHSVMDYLPPNIAGDKRRQGAYFMRDIGDYDVWAIRYGYSRVDVDDSPDRWTPESELSALAAIAREAVRPEYYFGTDDDTHRVVWGVDPASSAGDLGDDPLRFARDRLALTRGLVAQVDRRILRDSVGYDQLRSVVLGQISGREPILTNVAKLIGGSYVSRSHYNDPGAPEPFTPVPAAKQREALTLILQEAFAPGVLSVPPHLLNELLPSRMDNFGTWMPRPLDPPIHATVLGVQRDLLQVLLHPGRLQRLFDTEQRVERPSDAYAVSELLQTLSQGLFTEIWTGAQTKPIDSFRRDAQTEYVAQLSRLVLDSPTWPAPVPNGTRQDHAPAHARALARLELTELDGRLARVGARAARDDRAHIAALRDAIHQTLAAPIVITR
jgi:hypothetical protein